jgi:hypothetical protein
LKTNKTSIKRLKRKIKNQKIGNEIEKTNKKRANFIFLEVEKK